MIAAIIPTRYHPPELAVLQVFLAIDFVQMIVLESAEHDHAIYRMWNAGVKRARDAGATEIAILNDDIRILPGTLPRMAEMLRSDDRVAVVYPDVRASFADGLRWSKLESTTGTWGAAGMTGFCFMFKAELPLPAFDEGYNWWYGDDAFEENVRRAGYNVCRIEGMPIAHEPGRSAARRDDLGPLIEQDRARWDARMVPA